MKFTDGNWMMRKGVRAFYPAQAYQIEPGGDALMVYTPTRPIRHRADTLDGPLLTVRFSSPMPDVIGVRLAHYTGTRGRGPEFPLFASEAAGVTICVEEQAAILTSGRLSVRVARGEV